MSRLHIDSETYSELDINKVGTYAYATHPSTEVLMASYTLNNGPVKLWDATEEEMPRDLVAALSFEGTEIHAYNAYFERMILWHVLGMRIPTSRFHCTMIRAWMLSFAGTMEEVSVQLGLPPDKTKLARGKQLIQKFCKPAPRNHKADRYDRESHPAEWEEFRGYCVRDTVNEREIFMLLEQYPVIEDERNYWIMDQGINDNGLPIDMRIVNGAIRISKEETKHLIGLQKGITGLDNPNSVDQLKTWIQEQGVWMPNLRKETVAEYLTKYALPDNVKQVLELRQQSSKTSVKKYEALRRAVVNGRLHGGFQFAGAQRTQREAGRIFQPQNLARPKRKEPYTTAELLLYTWADADLIRAMFNNVMQMLSDTVRASVTAPEGRELCVYDLSSIESRVVGWLSGCKRINDIFANGLDTYKDFATVAFGIPYDEVTKEQRTYVKPPDLGCGYRLGGKGLVAYAAGMGVELSEVEAKRLVELWRETRPEVVQMWYWFDEAIMDTIQSSREHRGYGVIISRDRQFLKVQLPSGRTMYYYQPLVMEMVPPWEKEKEEEARKEGWEYIPKTKPTITYMGMAQAGQGPRVWKRIPSHGGKFTENFVQAIARDILFWQMHNLYQEIIELDLPMSIVGHVHDEIITEIPEGEGAKYSAILKRHMSTTPPWAPGLLLDAAGYVGKHYRKD